MDFSPTRGRPAQLEAATYNGSVGAMVLGPLFAAGGDVTVNAGTLLGSGTITAYGGPTVTVTNDSPDYLVLELDHHPGRAWRPGHLQRHDDFSSVLVARHPVGTRRTTGCEHPGNVRRGGPPYESEQQRAVRVRDRRNGDRRHCHSRPQRLYRQRGRSGRDHRRGRVVDPGGRLNANQVNISTQNGITAISNPKDSRATPAHRPRILNTSMYWPDAYDPYLDASVPSGLADVYVSFVANAMFNSDGQYGSDHLGYWVRTSDKSDRGTGSGDVGLTEDLIGTVGQTPPYSFDEPGGPGEPSTPQLVDGEPGSRHQSDFLGANTGDSTVVTPVDAAHESPVDGAYQFGDIAGRGEVPVVPVEPVGVTAEAYSQPIDHRLVDKRFDDGRGAHRYERAEVGGGCQR